MKILVTGGTGFIGKAVVKRLSANTKYEIILLVRTQHKAQSAPERIKFIKTDLLDPDLKQKIPKCDCVVHMAGSIDEHDTSLFETNVGGTRNLLKACDGKTKQIVFMSTAGVHGQSKGQTNEKSRFSPQTLYEKSKLYSELAVRRSNIPFTILRPTLVCGPNKYWAQIFNLAKKRFPVIGSGENMFHTVFLEDVVDAIENAVKLPAKNNEYLIAGPDPHTYLETYTEIAALFQQTPGPKLPVFIARILTFFFSLAGKKTIVSKEHITRLTRNRYYDTRKAQRELAWKPKTNLKEGLEKTFEVLKKYKKIDFTYKKEQTQPAKQKKQVQTANKKEQANLPDSGQKNKRPSA